MALDSADRHVARVRARVARGGHPIPEERVRERYDRSRVDLTRLVPRIPALRIFDNSHEADVERGELPKPMVLDFRDGAIRNRSDVPGTPPWAKSIVVAAMKVERSRR